MEIEDQKQKIGYLIVSKKYKLSVFGTSPRYDWTIVFLLGVILVIVASLLYYFDNKHIKQSISGDSLVREERNYFDIEKAKTLINNFETSRGQVDQTQ